MHVYDLDSNVKFQNVFARILKVVFQLFTNLKASWNPINEVNVLPALNLADCRVDVGRGEISSKQKTACHEHSSSANIKQFLKIVFSGMISIFHQVTAIIER